MQQSYKTDSERSFVAGGLSATSSEEALREQVAMAGALRAAWGGARKEECVRILSRVSVAEASQFIEVLYEMLCNIADSLQKPAKLDKPQELALLLLAERRDLRILPMLIRQLFVKKPYLHAHIIPLIRNYGSVASAHLIGVFSHAHDLKHIKTLVAIVHLLGDLKDPIANTTLLGLLTSRPLSYERVALYGAAGVLGAMALATTFALPPLAFPLIAVSAVGVPIAIATQSEKIFDAALLALGRIGDPGALAPLLQYADSRLSNSSRPPNIPEVESALKAMLLNITASHRGWLSAEGLAQLQRVMMSSDETPFLIACVAALKHLGDRRMYEFLQSRVRRSWLTVPLPQELQQAIHAVLPEMEARLLKEEEAFTLLRPSAAWEDERTLLRPATDKGVAEASDELLRPVGKPQKDEDNENS